MALIKCSECGREISDKAAACIHCGCPISAAKPAQNGNINLEETFGTYFGGFKVKPAAIQVDLNVRVFGEENGTTVSTVYVKELNENVTFNIPNNIQPGQCVRLVGKGRADANGLRGDLIFNMVTVQRLPAVQSAPAPAAQSAPKPAAQPVPAAKPAPAAAPTPNSADALEGAYRILQAYKPSWVPRLCARFADDPAGNGSFCRYFVAGGCPVPLLPGETVFPQAWAGRNAEERHGEHAPVDSDVQPAARQENAQLRVQGEPRGMPAAGSRHC